jgi:hypothetical protein
VDSRKPPIPIRKRRGVYGRRIQTAVSWNTAPPFG